jgi:hypothetical protein
MHENRYVQLLTKKFVTTQVRQLNRDGLAGLPV